MGVKITKISLFLIFVLVSTISSAVNINEIMYNPEGSDNNHEYIELYSEDILNLSGYTVEDIDSSDILTLLRQEESDYYLIVEEGFNHSNISVNIYSAGATIGNGLGNTEEIIILRDNEGKVIDAVKYHDSFGGDNNGRALCKNDYYLKECTPTPGEENSFIPEDYSFLEITEFVANPEGDDDAAMPDGEWIEIYNGGDKEVNLSGLDLNDDYGYGLNISQMNVIGSLVVEPEEYIVVYRNGNGRLELNNEGCDTVFLRYGTTIIDQVSYCDPKEGISYSKKEGYWANTVPSQGEENFDENYGKNSTIEILDIYDLGTDKKAKFGQSVRAKVEIYKGDSTKNIVETWIEDNGERISKETKVGIYERFTGQTLTLPIQLYPNCNGKYNDGRYEVHISGIDAEEQIYELEVEDITDSMCEKMHARNYDKKFKYSIVSMPTQVKVDELFNIKVEVENNEDKDYKVKLWSYAYRASKCYSGEREDNLKEIFLKAGTKETVDLYDSVDEEGEFSYKAVINKAGQKTNKEIRTKIKAVEEESLVVQNNTIIKERIIEKVKDSSSGVLYESSSFKAKKKISIILISSLVLLLLSLLFFDF